MGAVPLTDFDPQRLRKAMAAQEIVGGNGAAAAELAGAATVRRLDRGEQLFAAGQARSPAMFFIVSGSLRVVAHGAEVAVLSDRQSVGEFPVLDTKFNAHRVTAEAIEASVVAEVTAEAFEAIADRHPLLWRGLARSLAQRLDARNRALQAGTDSATQPARDLTKLTAAEILRSVTVVQVIAILSALLTLVGAGFWAGQRLPK